MVLTLAIVIFITVALVVFLFGAATVAPASTLVSRLRALGWRQPKAEKPAIRERLEQALDPLSKALPMSPTDVSKTRVWLMQAGYRESRHVSVYFGLRMLGVLLGFGVVIISGIGFNSPLLFIGIPAAGFLLPRFMLKRMIKERQRRIRLGLADALDLTVICVEAGLALDQAMLRVGDDLRHVHPDLSDEFSLLNLEMRAGKARAEALRNLAERTGVEDVKTLVAVLIQTDRFGTSISQALRVHSDALRTERRQRAEEQAAKTTIKLVPPLVVFVLPSVIFVTLGPAVIQLIRTLLPETR
jgi:tight adherence protein C